MQLTLQSPSAAKFQNALSLLLSVVVRSFDDESFLTVKDLTHHRKLAGVLGKVESRIHRAAESIF